jgi:hypothetical protein
VSASQDLERMRTTETRPYQSGETVMYDVKTGIMTSDTWRSRRGVHGLTNRIDPSTFPHGGRRR